MSPSSRPSSKPSEATIPAITSITVSGFKAHRDEREFEIRPLTVLAGANSSGKSSVMQALLLLKQTMDDRLPRKGLRLDEPHVRFDQYVDVAWRKGQRTSAASRSFTIGVGTWPSYVRNEYARGADGLSVALNATHRTWDSPLGHSLMVTTGEQQSLGKLAVEWGIEVPAPDELDAFGNWLQKQQEQAVRSPREVLGRRLATQEVGGLLHVDVDSAGELLYVGARIRNPRLMESAPQSIRQTGNRLAEVEGLLAGTALQLDDVDDYARTSVSSVLHLPGHRGDPKRRYSVPMVTAQQVAVPFSDIFAGVLLAWSQSNGDGERKLKVVGNMLRRLDLAWKIAVKREIATLVELKVSRLSRAQVGGSSDLVSLADVGFGVSQVLPVVVALVHAIPGQLVYIEQPEIHLHPRAQIELANLIVEACARGVRCVVETHSENVLMAFQIAVAKGAIQPEDVICHWFERDEEGAAHVESVTPGRDGSLGDWPVDFGDVSFKQQGEYIEAAVAARSKKTGRASGTAKAR